MMEAVIKIKNKDNGYIAIIDKTLYGDGESVQKYEYSYEETCAVDVIQLIKLNTEDNTTKVYFDDHNGENLKVKLSADGHYKVTHLLIPNEQWLTTGIDNGAVDLYNNVYYIKGETIYQYVADGSDIAVDWDLIVDDSNVLDTELDIVSISYLRDCYINYCTQIFNAKILSSCNNNNTVDNDLIYKRDLVWMALNVIKYLVECEYLSEAERYIELLTDCTGLCTTDGTSSNTSGGCGCS